MFKYKYSTFILVMLASIIILKNNISYADSKNEKKFKDLSIMVISSDGYSELWEPHFHFLFKHWPKLLKEEKYIPIYLINNLKSYNNPRVLNPKIGPEKSWSDNVLKTLEKIKTKYVLILLEDYIVTESVNLERLSEVLKLMEDTKGAYTEITLDPALIDGPVVKGHAGITLRSQTGKYRNSTQTCVWNTEILKKLLVSGESPWDFEMKGMIRSQQIKAPFYLLSESPVFSYLNAVDKRKYREDAVKYIKDEGLSFTASALPQWNK